MIHCFRNLGLGLALAGAGLLPFGEAHAERTFYASFDEGLVPDQAATVAVASKSDGIRFVPGIKGQAVVVGAQTYVTYATSGNVTPRRGSILFFAKPIGWSGEDELYHFFFSAQSAAKDCLIVYKVADTRLVFAGGRLPSSYATAGSDAKTWRDGEWRHIAVTWEGQDAQVYVNGVLAGKARWPVLPESLGQEFFVGGTPFADSAGEQAVDELILHDRPLTEAEIQQYLEPLKPALERANREGTAGDGLGSRDQPLSGRLLFHASFDEKLDADEAAGSGKATVTGDVQLVEGVSGKAALMGAKRTWTYPLKGNLVPERGTLACWLKPVDWPSQESGYHYFVSLNGPKDWLLLQTIDDNLAFLGGTHQTYSFTAASMAGWENGLWRHVTVTWREGRNRVFLDGAPASAWSAWPVVPRQLGEVIRLGGQLFGTTTGQTAIDDFRIYDRCLEDREVAALYEEVIRACPQLVEQHEFMKKQQKMEPDNIAKPEFGVIPIPSSQSAATDCEVEKVLDGDFATKWVSAKGTFPNWVELRWPQPVMLERLVINEDPLSRSAAYRIEVLVDGKWKQIVPWKNSPSRPGERIVEEFTPVETIRVRYYMLAPAAGAATDGSSAIIEMQACGKAEAMTGVSGMEKPNWKSHWIWFPEGPVDDVQRFFRKHFAVEDPAALKEAWLQIAADDTYEVYLNGQAIGNGGIITTVYDIKPRLRKGDNVIAVKCHEFSIFEGLIAEVSLVPSAGEATRIVTDSTWKASDREVADWFSPALDESGWKNCKTEGMPPNCSDHASQPYHYTGPREKFTLKSCRVTPAEVKAGAKAQILLEVEVAEPLRQDYAFQLRIGEPTVSLAAEYTVASRSLTPSVPTSKWSPGQPQTLTASIMIPDWAPHGEIPLFLTPVGKGVEGAIASHDNDQIGVVKIRRFKKDPKPWPATPPKAEVKESNGHPTLFVDGKVLAPAIMTEQCSPSYQAYGEHAKAGLHVWRVGVRKGVHSLFNLADPARENADYFAAVDQNVQCLLKMDPEAYVIVTTDFDVAQEWTDRYPDDATLLADGRRIQHSFSSRRWLEKARADVTELVRHLMRQPYSGHIIGLHFALGGETFYWGLNTNPGDAQREQVIVGDYSPEHIRAFREWLKEKYHGQVEELRAAWKDRQVTFATAQPDIQTLRRSDLLVFRDPARTRLPMDYWEFHSDVMAQRAIDIGRAIKEASGGRYITGLWGFYSDGFNIAGASPGRGHHCAYSGLHKVLESPWLDLLVPLRAYTNVRWGTPCLPINLAGSIRRHNKMVLVEYDTRTFFTLLRFTERTFSQPETLSVLRREMAAASTRGDAFWWVGFQEGTTGRISVPWFSEESIVRCIRGGCQMYEAAYRQDLSSVSEVAVFMSNTDLPGLDLMLAHPLLQTLQYNPHMFELPRLGAPYDLYDLADIGLPGMDRYKVYVFLNANVLTSAQREQIKAVVRQPGKTAVWLYAPGFSDGVSLSVDHVAETTGFKVGYEPITMVPEATIEAGRKLTRQLDPGHVLRPRPYQCAPNAFQIGPVFHIEDPEAEVLGRYAHNGKPACAAKKIGEATSVLLAVPAIDAPVLREICRGAGVHLYYDGNILLDATRQFISITATAEGVNGVIRLPAKACVRDVFNNQVLGQEVDQFEAHVPPLTTALYYLGDRRQVAAFPKVKTD